ncbi:MPN527 family putative ECF transporter permease subunit [Mycoplasmopsis felifaucium]|uniref:MPN527 family putative ECF transporter permease subunit n=1 Tax=Mycoplasmopsis felifaucium TaxID=35768 RepID=UPI000A4C2719|nr:hypothetical protein [Mycoplasmopsis felifaucium]
MSKIYYSNRIVYKIAISGFLFAIAILVNFICSKFFAFPIASFLKFDFSLVVITVSTMIVGLRYSYLLILLFMLIGPSYGSLGYSYIGILGHFILAISQVIYITIFHIMNLCLSQKDYNKASFVILKLSISSLITIILMILFNIFLFTPWYFKLFNQLPNLPATYNSMVIQWDKFKGLFLNINNYFAGSLTIYLSFNFINLLINSIIIFIIIKLNKNTNFITNKNHLF